MIKNLEFMMVVLLSAIILSSVATATDMRPVLPPVHHLDTEVVTNVAVSAQGSREYAFELTFSGTASNNVEIAFGADTNGDGALSVDEIGFSAGWDCGEWFVMNSATGERAMASAADKAGAALYYPSPILCTDNAAMIGAMAFYDYQIGKIAGLDLAADPSLAIGES